MKTTRRYQSTLVSDTQCNCPELTLKYMGMTQNETPVRVYWCHKHNTARRIDLTEAEMLRYKAGARIGSARPATGDGSAAIAQQRRV